MSNIDNLKNVMLESYKNGSGVKLVLTNTLHKSPEFLIVPNKNIETKIFEIESIYNHKLEMKINHGIKIEYFEEY